MNLSKSLLLVVDVQQGFMNQYTTPVLDPINKLVKHWEGKGWPVVCSRFVNLPGSNWRRLRNWHELTSEPETLLAKNIDINTPYIFKKSTYSAWSHEVSAVCLSEQVSNIVLVGVDTNECVLATAMAIFEDGFTPWVVADACASGGGPEVHETAVTMLKNLIGDQQIINVEEIT